MSASIWSLYLLNSVCHWTQVVKSRAKIYDSSGNVKTTKSSGKWCSVHLFLSASALWISVCSQISFQVFLNSMSNSILRKHSSDKNIQDLFQALKASIPTSTEIPQWAGKCGQYDIMKGTTKRRGREGRVRAKPAPGPAFLRPLNFPTKLFVSVVCMRTYISENSDAWQPLDPAVKFWKSKVLLSCRLQPPFSFPCL